MGADSNPRFCTKCGSERVLTAQALIITLGDLPGTLEVGDIRLPQCVNPECGEIYVSPDSPQGRLLYAQISSMKVNLGMPEESEVKIVPKK